MYIITYDMYIITFKPENAPTHNICTSYVHVYSHTENQKSKVKERPIHEDTVKESQLNDTPTKKKVLILPNFWHSTRMESLSDYRM